MEKKLYYVELSLYNYNESATLSCTPVEILKETEKTFKLGKNPGYRSVLNKDNLSRIVKTSLGDLEVFCWENEKQAFMEEVVNMKATELQEKILYTQNQLEWVRNHKVVLK